MRSRKATVRVLGTDVDLLTGSEALAAIGALPPHAHYQIAYVNAHSLNIAYRSPEFQAALNRCQMVLNDGVGLGLAARLRGVRFAENLNGTDFTMRILALAAERSWRIYLYGGRPGVAEKAATRLRARIPGLVIAGATDGYSSADVAMGVRAAASDLVVVALGQPLQELWLSKNIDLTGCTLGVGVGAFLDFASGRVTRAPRWMTRLGLEWTYRLAREPVRLGRRYIIGNPLFVWRAWRLSGEERMPVDVSRRSVNL